LFTQFPDRRFVQRSHRDFRRGLIASAARWFRFPMKRFDVRHSVGMRRKNALDASVQTTTLGSSVSNRQSLSPLGASPASRSYLLLLAVYFLQNKRQQVGAKST